MQGVFPGDVRDGALGGSLDLDTGSYDGLSGRIGNSTGNGDCVRTAAAGLPGDDTGRQQHRHQHHYADNVAFSVSHVLLG